MVAGEEVKRALARTHAHAPEGKEGGSRRLRSKDSDSFAKKVLRTLAQVEAKHRVTLERLRGAFLFFFSIFLRFERCREEQEFLSKQLQKNNGGSNGCFMRERSASEDGSE